MTLSYLRLTAIAVLFFQLQFVAATAQEVEAAANDVVPNSPHVRQLLDKLVPELRADHGLVGLGAMVMIDGEVLAVAVDGERKLGSGSAIEIGDRWHIGSITKSITATMTARLVERDVLKWTTTVGECFGSSLQIHPGYADVSVEQLLTHTAGAPQNFSVMTQFRHPAEGPERVSMRRSTVAGILNREPVETPGESFAYSNVGVTIAASMVEEMTGQSWEDLVRKEVFTPLLLTHAGFGPPTSQASALTQPRGHAVIGPWKFAAAEDTDNSPIMGPAGAAHMPLAELCKFGQEHLAGEKGQGELLDKDTYKNLHTPRLNKYAFGWVVTEDSKWTQEPVLWHNGSNKMWFALLVLFPERNAVVAVTSNDGDIKRAQTAASQILQAFAEL